MLNIDAFLKRLEQLMENHQLNAAAFAEKIGVQRSSVSHILSRRNKPSLEFILKVQAEFTEADLTSAARSRSTTRSRPRSGQGGRTPSMPPSGPRDCGWAWGSAARRSRCAPWFETARTPRCLRARWSRRVHTHRWRDARSGRRSCVPPPPSRARS